MATKGRKGKNTISVDFEGVEAGGGSVKIPDDNYMLALAEVSQESSENKQPYLSCQWKVVEGEFKGARVYDNLSLQPQALWRLRGMLEAAGYDVPDSVYELDLDDLVGVEVYCQVENEEYQGKDRPRITAFLGDEAPEPEVKKGKGKAEPETKAKGKKAADPEPEDDDGGKASGSKRKRKAAAIDEGSQVTFEDDGDTYEGEVTSIDGKIATVKTDDGDEWEIPLDELTAA